MGRDERRKLEKIKQKNDKILSSENPTMIFEVPRPLLLQYGLIITTQLSISNSHFDYLVQNKLPVPSPVQCRFLVDTGATRSMVKHKFAEQAGLKLISESTPIHGVGVDTTGKTYFGRISFITNSTKVENVKHHISVEAQIISGTLHDSEIIDGLIGRDVLQYFDLKINGNTGRITMAYIRN